MTEKAERMQTARFISSQCWTDSDTSHIPMYPNLAEAFAKRIAGYLAAEDRHAEELLAYEVTVGNLREQAQPAPEPERLANNPERWIEEQPDGSFIEYEPEEMRPPERKHTVAEVQELERLASKLVTSPNAEDSMSATEEFCKTVRRILGVPTP
jgi:hypothetical protein